jgi:WD repeat-containing protein 68
MLASGGDDSLVLVWDLLHSHNGAVVNGDVGSGTGIGGGGQIPPPPPAPVAGAPAGPSSGTQQAANVNLKGPAASWRCDYEIANLSWAPQSGLTGQGGEWVGVAGGRGVWGVKL